MRLLAFLVFAALVYFLFVRAKSTPTADQIQPAPVAEASPLPHSPGNTNILKRPLDRAHEALDANRQRTSEEAP